MRRAACRRGVTLLEMVVCLAVLGLFVTGFIRHLGSTSAASARLEEREKAESVARMVRALLASEDPWTAPASRSLRLDESGNQVAAGSDGYEVRISGSVLCAGGAVPLDNVREPPPGACPAGAQATRRWRIAVSYNSLYGTGLDSVTAVVDADASGYQTSNLLEGSTP